MKFDCRREQCRRKDRPSNEYGIFVVDPPVFGHAGSGVSGKKQMVFEYGQLPRLNDLVYRWVKSGRMTVQEFQKYMSMIAEPMSPLQTESTGSTLHLLHA